MNGRASSKGYAIGCAITIVAILSSACNSDGSLAPTTDETLDNGTPIDENNVDMSVALTCDEIAARFVTRGSANVDLPDPEVSATCEDDTVIISANGIPDFPYIATSPGVPTARTVEYEIPATPIPAETVTEIPIVGSIAVAINGIPIYGPTEGPGGDVLSRPGGFTECGGHNGPTGYHYHIFDVTGSDFCLFTEADVTSEPQLFGYAFDGYPIYSGNTRYTSSWYLSDESLFATDTWSAHSYVEGSGDLDRCNGRTDDDGEYAYYTTDSFPYVMGCFRGIVEQDTDVGSGGGAR